MSILQVHKELRMNRVLLTGLVVATLLFSSPVRADAPQLSLRAIKYGWRSDYEAARVDARRMNKPMMIVFRCVP